MKTLLQKFQKMAMAVTYAEAGEWATAQGFLPESEPRSEFNWLENHFAAVAFAESGLPQEAVRISSGKVTSRPLGHDIYDGFGLKGVHFPSVS